MVAQSRTSSRILSSPSGPSSLMCCRQSGQVAARGKGHTARPCSNAMHGLPVCRGCIPWVPSASHHLVQGGLIARPRLFRRFHGPAAGGGGRCSSHSMTRAARGAPPTPWAISARCHSWVARQRPRPLCHTTHGVHLNTQGVRLSLYQRYRYSLSSGTQGAGAVRYGPSPGTGGAGTGHPPVPPVHGALRCSMAGVPAEFERVL